jgi:hypothetical protein
VKICEHERCARACERVHEKTGKGANAQARATSRRCAEACRALCTAECVKPPKAPVAIALTPLQKGVLDAIRKVPGMKFADMLGYEFPSEVPSFTHRELDKALQRVRKAGLVSYDTKAGWSAVRWD